MNGKKLELEGTYVPRLCIEHSGNFSKPNICKLKIIRNRDFSAFQVQGLGRALVERNGKKLDLDGTFLPGSFVAQTQRRTSETRRY